MSDVVPSSSFRQDQALGGTEGSHSQVAWPGFDNDTRISLEAFSKAAARPEDFNKPSPELAGLARLATKALFDFTAATQGNAKAEGPSELYVDGFDAEQIWSQLDASNNLAFRHLRKRLKKLPEDLTLLEPSMEAILDELLEQDASGNPPSSGGASSSREDSSSEDPGQSGSEEVSEIEDDSEEEDIDATKGALNAATRKGGTSKAQLHEEEGRALLPTEDQFLRLDDMERFVQDAEEAALLAKAKEDESDEASGSESESGDSAAEGSLGGTALPAEDESASDEDDAELARLLESASELAGQKRKRKAKEETAEDADDKIMYEDFFGPRGRAGAGTRGRDLSENEPAGLHGEPSEGSDLAEFEADDLADVAEASDADNEGFIIDGEGRGLGTTEASGSFKKLLEAGVKEEGLSGHERRMLRIAERARKLEQENIGEKEWYMRGEAGAASRPLNSALEIDLDFERAVQPPPQPTEESTGTLEDLIKRRIAERSFDDPVRRAPPPDTLQKELAKLDDRKASKGLGEVYEEEYVRAKSGNVLDDKDEKTRSEARLLLKELFAKLDALSHFHFAPKPIIQDPTIRKEVPALAMEEVAPQVVSEAARLLPEEVYKPPKDAVQGELTRAERRTKRAAKKRAFKKRKAQQDVERRQRAAQADGNVIGRKSDDAEAAASSAGRRSKKKQKGTAGEGAPRINYTKSSAVFGKIQDERDARKLPAAKPETNLKSAQFKL